MLTLSKRNQLFIGLVLAALMAATRGHHFATLAHLPGASWAVFFLAGVYLRPWSVFPALLALAAFIDYAAVTWGGVSSFCISPAYVFLLPAYASLWFAGRWYARRHRFAWGALPALALSAFGGAAICEFFSSGGFYFFSGRFAETTVVEFIARLAKYFPSAVESMAFYVGLAVLIHIAIATVSRPPAATTTR